MNLVFSDLLLLDCRWQEVKPVSDWQLMKLNAPEWPLLVIGSVAAFLQGTCFPVFALLFGYASGVSNFFSSYPRLIPGC